MIVKNVKVIETNEIPVYDITVEDNHNYFIFSNNSYILSHNCEYLHGEVSLEGVIVNLAQNFVGSNNLPLLSPEGSFGTRFIPEAGASRYIYTKMQPYLTDIFKKEDEPLLEKQYFEGSQIEYKYYVPIIPILLINGNEGISSGFAQKILPRDINEIKEAIISILNDNFVDRIKPSYNEFEGNIIQIGENSYEIQGVIEKGKRNTICVPILYVSTDITTPLFLSKKTSSLRLRANLFFLAILKK
jgi:DNA topoisomerase-2